MCVNAKDVILHLHTLVPQHYLERDATHNEQKTSNNHMAETIDIRLLNAQIEAETGFITDLVEGMNRTIVGQKHLVNSLLIGLLSDGHILLEGVPGLAKTLAIKTLASLIDAKFGRLQFTPDLLPADVIGTMIYSQKDESFKVKKGPIFANFVLADEINRAPAKVQSALLEAMQEHQVTIGDNTFALPNPFLVLATQNPIEQEGTYELPEAQVDRFMMKVIIDYPTIDEEKKIMRAHINDSFSHVSPVIDTDRILKARQLVKQVYIDERIEQYIADIVFATRYPEQYKLKDFKTIFRLAVHHVPASTWLWPPVLVRLSSAADTLCLKMCARWQPTCFATALACRTKLKHRTSRLMTLSRKFSTKLKCPKSEWVTA